MGSRYQDGRWTNRYDGVDNDQQGVLKIHDGNIFMYNDEDVEYLKYMIDMDNISNLGKFKYKQSFYYKQ